MTIRIKSTQKINAIADGKVVVLNCDGFRLTWYYANNEDLTVAVGDHENWFLFNRDQWNLFGQVNGIAAAFNSWAEVLGVYSPYIR